MINSDLNGNNSAADDPEDDAQASGSKITLPIRSTDIFASLKYSSSMDSV
ncbi:2950_t:CDS:2 [Funneliformis caledonium]|uniref:2950_t:CDS:1 n=1 Tax=Funneliformis caledonium TaxID=1117310 RepID=A0A9N9HQ55_9GLOM|nr:2950_t:CDS:2 [Funneliformis caledonium]